MGSTSFEKVTGADCSVATAAIANTARTRDVITLPPRQQTATPCGLKVEGNAIALLALVESFLEARKIGKNSSHFCCESSNCPKKLRLIRAQTNRSITPSRSVLETYIFRTQ